MVGWCFSMLALSLIQIKSVRGNNYIGKLLKERTFMDLYNLIFCLQKATDEELGKIKDHLQGNSKQPLDKPEMWIFLCVYVCMCVHMYVHMYECVCVCSYVIPLLKMCFPHLSRFLYQLSLIPNFPQRLNCLLFSCTFADSASSMTHKLSTLQKACRSLRHSKPVSSYMYMSLRTTPSAS